jgi:fatty-acyl-CoA synthase
VAQGNGEGLAAPSLRRAALDDRFPSWRPSTVTQVVDAAVEEFADRPLIITDEQTHSYRDVQAWSRRLAAGLIALGVGPGDRVAMVMANYPEFVAVKFAIARTGAACVPINFLFRAAELGYVIAQSEAKVLVTMDRFGDLDYLSALEELAPDWKSAGGGEAAPHLQRVVVFSPTGQDLSAMTLDQLEAAGTDASREQLTRREQASDAEALSDILYTSGTTGTPKGVLLSHDHITRMAYAAAYSRALEDGRRLCYPMPMYHVFGYIECLMAVLYVGGAVVPLVRFDPADMLQAVERHKVNEIVAVPAVTLPLIAEARRGSYDLSSVHTVFSSGGAAPDRIWDDIRDAFGSVEITTGYGMTETTAATTTTLPEDDDSVLRTTNGRVRFAGAAGDPELGGAIAAYKAVDPESEEDLPPGQRGHLLVRGPVVTPGYYRKPEETAQAFTNDGWLRTGDIGTIDANGDLQLTGRLKESLRVGGEMVMPKEIESVLEQHPDVVQAHVVGIPHPRMGEVACAWVIPKDPQDPPAGADLVAHCTERLARFKVPRHVVFTQADELPLTAVGRVQKFRLAEMSQQRLDLT